ncbi:response regulator [Robertmurraya andreesenii]|uniref:histidine kinase n=1 Tax=Anoxybacillus andreesenii TaxID=1325932 RepID=A0ABT9V6T5_9BACL|nr:response regulator [Robertmurraya andreesenii]MDQ0156659.1 two-component system chemotaxis sensor kinase CheA [Robertmurraya andreesenii]
MKYTTRLYLGFSSVIILITILIALIVGMLNNQNQEISNLVEDRYQKIKLINHIRVNIKNIDRELNEMVFENANEQKVNKIQKIRDASILVDEDLAVLKEIIQFKDAKLQLANINAQIKAYNTTVDQVISLVVVDDIEHASSLFVTSNEQYLQIINTSEELISIQERIMEDTLASTEASYNLYVKIALSSIILAIVFGYGISRWVIKSIIFRFKSIRAVMNSIEYGSENLPRIKMVANDEIGEIAQAYNKMAEALEKHERTEREYVADIEGQNWVSSKLSDLSMITQESAYLHELGDKYLQEIVPSVEATHGVLYVLKNDGTNPYLEKISSYADVAKLEGGVKERVELGEGLIGQCAKDGKPIYLFDIPEDYLSISSGLGETSPNTILIYPIMFNGSVIAVIELASLERFEDLHENLLIQAMNQLAIAIYRINQQAQVRELLEESQALNEELQTQSEELQLQQEELQTINEELEAQYKHSEQKTKDLEAIKYELEEKTRQLQLSSKYKSEFLANMSHELRTPLNSMIILAQILQDNKEDNLTEKQKEYASTIYAAGKDLLLLINDILDLAKIESGKANIQIGEMEFGELVKVTERQFRPVAEQKGIEFSVEIEKDIPNIIYTDEQKVHQILKNLISNAIKFTEKGQVQLRVKFARFAENPNEYISFQVSDTGIGISSDNKQLIFEAFQQEDGTTSRRYGGTGLGLSISKELADLLGGKIHIESEVGKGSVFSFYLPVDMNEKTVPIYDEVAGTIEDLNEDRAVSLPVPDFNCEEVLNGKRVLVVDDDMRNVFSLTTALEGAGMHVAFAENGREALEFLETDSPVDIVLMDIMMPEMDGYETMRLIRRQEKWKKMPIIALTAKAMNDDRKKCIDAGASDYISKPVKLEQLFSLLKVWLHK